VPVKSDDDWLNDQGVDAGLLFWAQTAHGWIGEPPSSLGLAVSGGSDSMAMLHLMARAAVHSGWALQAVTVDHCLRPEAAAEADFVGQVCLELGVPHQVLKWDHGMIEGNLMHAARQARYGLMAEWAKSKAIGHILLAHTADDQAETFLMGLSRAAGLDGLSGMRTEWMEGGVKFRRPFLRQTRAELRDFLTRHGLTWIDDPSNDNDRFTRVKARRALKALRPLGITVDRLATVVHHLSMAQGVVERAVADVARKVVREVAGGLILDRKAFRFLDPEVERRLLISAIMWVSCAPYAPRESSIFRLGHAIRAGRDATLWGARFRTGETEIRIVRELRAVSGVQSRTNQLWDNRWRVEGPHEVGLVVGALGAEGLRVCKNWRSTGISRDALLVSPGIWQGETLVSAPLAGFANGWTAEIPASFSRFIVSH
jgi:tRNA(Ile)-lysidine synthase